MHPRMVELLVGGFVAAAIVSLVILAVQVSGLNPGSKGDTYTVYAEFNDTGSLAPRGRISLSGVTVGRIQSIELDPGSYRAVVKMEIRADVDDIAADSTAVIRTAGLLGEQYIDISLGGDPESLRDGDFFYDTQSAMNLEQLISNFATGM